VSEKVLEGLRRLGGVPSSEGAQLTPMASCVHVMVTPVISCTAPVAANAWACTEW
jgi:hypothetical protein